MSQSGRLVTKITINGCEISLSIKHNLTSKNDCHANLESTITCNCPNQSTATTARYLMSFSFNHGNLHSPTQPIHATAQDKLIDKQDSLALNQSQVENNYPDSGSASKPETTHLCKKPRKFSELASNIWSGCRDIIVDMANEALKKTFWPRQ